MKVEIKVLRRWELLAKILCFGLLAVSVLILFYVPILKIGLKEAIDYNEGWNAYHAQDVVFGRNLYSSDLTPVNYPPFSFYLLAALSKVVGDPLFVGRIIALISLAGVAVVVYLILKDFTRNKFLAAFFSILCLGFFAALGTSYVGMNDPQLLGHALEVFALFLFLKGKRTLKNFVFVAFLLVLGLFTKHNLLILPLTITAAVFDESFKDFLKWLLIFLTWFGLFFAGAQLISGGNFLPWILFARQFSPQHIINLVFEFLLKITLPLFAAFAFAVFSKKLKILPVFAYYFVLALIFGIILSGGVGVDVNIFFDLFISTALILGLGVNKVLEDGFRRLKFGGYVLLFLLAMNIFLAIPDKYFEGEILPSNPKKLQVETLSDIAFLEKYQGKVLCEQILLCYFAGKSFVFDPFLTGQMVVTGKLNEAEYVSYAKEGVFTIIQLNKPLEDSYYQREYSALKLNHRFTDNFLIAVADNYKLERTSSNGAFYVYNKLQ